MIFTVPVRSIMMFSRPQVLVQHLQAVEGLQARAICSTMPRTVSSVAASGLSIIHCARVWPSMYSVTT